MKHQIRIGLFLCACFLLVINGRGFGEPQTETGNQSAHTNYFVSRYVFGSGGIIGASNPNSWHHATVGETCVGGMEGPNHFMLAGFWTTGLFFTDIEQKATIETPISFRLYQNYPNPFNPETIIEYELPIKCSVTIEIFNTTGQKIRSLSTKTQGPGYMQTTWDGRDDLGRTVGSGVYLYRIATSSMEESTTVRYQQTKKMLLVK